MGECSIEGQDLTLNEGLSLYENQSVRQQHDMAAKIDWFLGLGFENFCLSVYSVFQFYQHNLQYFRM